MKFALIRLMKDGRQLSRDELETSERFTGNFVVEVWTEGNSFTRPIKRARLLSLTFGPSYDLLPPLFEPDLLKVTDTRMTLRGFEINVEEGQARQVAQEWLLKPVE
jgi:hypothetical protein